MIRLLLKILLPLVLSLPAMGSETVNTEERLSGFAEHQNRQKRYDKAREKGEREFLEEKDQWERQSERALKEYKKQKKDRIMAEDGPEARADALAKKKRDQAYEESYKAYVQEKARKAKSVKKRSDLPTEAEELDLINTRPRYDVKKRVDYGGTPKYGKNSGGSSRGGGGGGSGYSPPFNPGSSPSFPDVDVDPPGLPDGVEEDFGDIPPPPPPPGFGGDDMEGDFPPPPPPPPLFDDGF